MFIPAVRMFVFCRRKKVMRVWNKWWIFVLGCTVSIKSCFCNTFNPPPRKRNCVYLSFQLFSWFVSAEILVFQIKRCKMNCSKLWTHHMPPILQTGALGGICWKWRLGECDATVRVSQFFHDLNIATSDSIRCLAKFLALWTRVSLTKNLKDMFSAHRCPTMRHIGVRMMN